MEQKITFHFQSIQERQKRPCLTDILKSESGSRRTPILAALETHIHHQHSALNMNEGKHTFRADTDKNKSDSNFQNS